ncbi:aminotransferase class I/II-fold pyridoxal phosphate-dependent enzyme [Caballeronia novacaledonica]|jgi:perosamine synthetase|uniref:DegT/DnrJ/EryC1/StrS family aminotransferase n=1 Tax=Caballeronia novacaledonica TaxID=1544861 RepID=UPI001EE3863C|nr:DegT/DnrJ/EryC1/StrS family aminotransferase [Caballeronia novacaledonica]GJH13520.1 aminotransferase class I/II-fold pyridoxal phosphate-dependent enzyme [Caballeronia novacaledonica]
MIPVNEPLLDGNERLYLNECIESGWISSDGAFVERFERAMADYVGRKHAIAVANGSAALDVAAAALGLGPGDEVIIPTHTIISCASAIVRTGASLRLVDSDSQTWNMDVTKIEDAISSRTRAIMAVHTFGLPVDMTPLLDIASKHGLAVIEDAAQAIGQTYDGAKCGSFGDISCFSFYANKHITTGEGGMIVCDDDALAARARSLRNLCFKPERRFVHEELGWNYRMSSLQAAVGLAQFERLDAHIERKRELGRRYESLLRGVRGVELAPLARPYAENVYWVFGVMLDDSLPFGADEARSMLAEMNVSARPFFWPMHEQPVFRNQGLFDGERYPVAERMSRRGFYLPSGLALTETQQDHAVAAVRMMMAKFL